MRCWGSNAALQLGVEFPAYSDVPVQASLATGAVAIAAGTDHTCAITTAGAAVCWGANSEGERGDGSVPVPVIPVPVLGYEGPAVPEVPALSGPWPLLLALALLGTGPARRLRAGASARGLLLRRQA